MWRKTFYTKMNIVRLYLDCTTFPCYKVKCILWKFPKLQLNYSTGSKEYIGFKLQATPETYAHNERKVIDWSSISATSLHI